LDIFCTHISHLAHRGYFIDIFLKESIFYEISELFKQCEDPYNLIDLIYYKANLLIEVYEKEMSSYQ